jgi:hypothetical protein
MPCGRGDLDEADSNSYGCVGGADPWCAAFGGAAEPYDLKPAVALGVGAKVADGHIVMDNRPLKNVELFIARIGGKPRVVAAKQ